VQNGRLERVTFGTFAAFVAALQLSIAAANILLGLTAVAWIALLVRDRRRPSAPAFFLPLAIFAACTLVSSIFSLDPRASFIDDRQLLLLAIVPIAYNLASRGRATTLTMVLISVGAASAAVGIVQYALLHYDSLALRPHGTLGHYMTYAGTLMLIICIVAVLYAAKAFFLPVMMAFVVGTMLAPAARYLEQHRIPRAVSAVLIVAAACALVVFMIGLIATPVIEWSARLPEPGSRFTNRTPLRARSSTARMPLGFPGPTTRPSSHLANVTTRISSPGNCSRT